MPKGLRRQCTICANPERGRIDYLLVCSAGSHGEGRRALAKKFGVSADALWRHAKNHISEDYRAAVKVGPFESEGALRKLLAETGASVLTGTTRCTMGIWPAGSWRSRRATMKR